VQVLLRLWRARNVLQANYSNPVDRPNTTKLV
jgi:hypothetical protein